MRYPKTFMSSPGKPHVQFYRGKLGEPLNVKCAGFNLDPNMRVTHGAYNCLHDPLLKSFFRQPQRKKQLLKQGLITTDDRVLCSLRELNQYVSYVNKVQLSWNEHYHQQQKQLLTGFLMDKVEGRSPQKVNYTRMTNWLISRSRTTFRKLSNKIMKPGGNLRDAELAWEVGQRLQLEKLHKEIIRELRLNRPPHRVPTGIRKSGGATLAPPCSLVAASVAKEPASRDRVVGKRANGAGDLVVAEEHLRHEPAPAVPAVSTTMDLVTDQIFLRNIQDSPFSDCSLPEISSYKSSELQSYASYESLDYAAMMDLASPDAKETMDFLNGILKRDQDSPISEIHTEALSPSRLSSDSPADGSSELQHVPVEKEASEGSDLSVDLSPESFSPSPLSSGSASAESPELQGFYALSRVVRSSDLTLSSDSDDQVVEPHSVDFVNGVLGGTSETSLASCPSYPVSLYSPSGESTELRGHSSMGGTMESPDVTLTRSLDPDAKMVSPDTLVSRDLVSNVLRWIQVLPTSETSFITHLDSPASFSASSDSQSRMVSPDSEVTMDLVNGVLKRIEESPSAFRLLETSSDESSELQRLSGMGGMSENWNPPDSPVLEGRLSSPASYGSSDVVLVDLEMSSHSSLTSLNVSPMSSDMGAPVISPTSEVAFDLVRGVLENIQDSSSLDLRLSQSSCHEDPELQSLSENDMGPNPPFAIREAWGSSPASSASADLTLIDLEMCVDSSSASATSLSMTWGAQRISPKSDAIRDLVSDVLRNIQDSPCSDHSLSDPSSLVETTSIHAFEGVEADVAQSDAAGPAGTENPNMRKRVHTFFTRSWKSVRRIFAFARRSTKVHPL